MQKTKPKTPPGKNARSGISCMLRSECGDKSYVGSLFCTWLLHSPSSNLLTGLGIPVPHLILRTLLHSQSMESFPRLVLNSTSSATLKEISALGMTHELCDKPTPFSLLPTPWLSWGCEYRNNKEERGCQKHLETRRLVFLDHLNHYRNDAVPLTVSSDCVILTLLTSSWSVVIHKSWLEKGGKYPYHHKMQVPNLIKSQWVS